MRCLCSAFRHSRCFLTSVVSIGVAILIGLSACSAIVVHSLSIGPTELLLVRGHENWFVTRCASRARQLKQRLVVSGSLSRFEGIDIRVLNGSFAPFDSCSDLQES